MFLHRLKAVSVEREKGVATRSGEAEEEEESDASDREETEVQTGKKKQQSSYEAAGDSDVEAIGKPNEGEEEEEGEEETEEREGEGGEVAIEEESDCVPGEKAMKQIVMDKNRVNVRVIVCLCVALPWHSMCRKWSAAVQRWWTTAMMQRMDFIACLL